jgi:hypothetical protein
MVAFLLGLRSRRRVGGSVDVARLLLPACVSASDHHASRGRGRRRTGPQLATPVLHRLVAVTAGCLEAGSRSPYRRGGARGAPSSACRPARSRRPARAVVDPCLTTCLVRPCMHQRNPSSRHLRSCLSSPAVRHGYSVAGRSSQPTPRRPHPQAPDGDGVPPHS